LFEAAHAGAAAGRDVVLRRAHACVMNQQHAYIPYRMNRGIDADALGRFIKESGWPRDDLN
jgi:hypothetical protein